MPNPTEPMNDRDGPAPPPSRLYLPKLERPPRTILEHLIGRFPQVSPDEWSRRIARGRVTSDDGTIVTKEMPYRHGTTVYYRKEVAGEPDTPLQEIILYQDEEILVADKPHGMVVTPAGDHLERCLLVRLQRRTGLGALAPAHRLDRETGGLVLLSVNPYTRAQYHGLFQDGAIEREYLAMADVVRPPQEKRWHVRNRLASGEPWFRQRIVDGLANAFSDIELLEVREGTGLFRILPKSGKKHQIRIHMASIGYPIVGDRLYPKINDTEEPGSTLQLLARRLKFIDPLSAESRNFSSTLELRWPEHSGTSR